MIPAEHCDFGDRKGEFLRDGLVAGMSDKEVSERLRLEYEPVSLETTLQAARTG